MLNLGTSAHDLSLCGSCQPVGAMGSHEDVQPVPRPQDYLLDLELQSTTNLHLSQKIVLLVPKWNFPWAHESDRAAFASVSLCPPIVHGPLRACLLLRWPVRCSVFCTDLFSTQTLPCPSLRCSPGAPEPKAQATPGSVTKLYAQVRDTTVEVVKS